MRLKEMIEEKEKMGYSYEEISELSGVPTETVVNYFEESVLPEYTMLLALERLFGETEVAEVHENVPAYWTKKPGEYTIEDYYELPEERRAELIDGVFYDMSAPTTIHQLIVGEIYMILKNYIKRKQGTCITFVSPIDVKLREDDDKTMVQPDVLVQCDRDKIKRRGIFDAPDFVAEVLSKSTKKKDMNLKLKKYKEAGVREYWMIDPDKQKVIVHNFMQGDTSAIYGFDAAIPVAIFDEECQIDFKEIEEYVEFLL